MQELTDSMVITVDGRQVEVAGGQTILTAVQATGVDIPALCHDVRLERANGNCGLCVVEVGEDRREVKSCITPVSAGMVIHTRSDTVDAYRKVRVCLLYTSDAADE